ncbi:8-amino-7-oxononanoate synthase / CqsA [Vibrio astriarenae]|nr:8-amino-7-oxononanoate synthase / CqsA [Vibrio sp. C7]
MAYPAIFSSALLPAEVSRLEKTLEVIKTSNTAREQLMKNSQAIIAGLREIGFRIRSESQIIALECGSERNTEKVRDFLEHRGVFGAVFCRPATGKNNNIIRFSVHADLKPEQIEHVLNVCYTAFHHPDLEFN